MKNVYKLEPYESGVIVKKDAKRLVGEKAEEKMLYVLERGFRAELSDGRMHVLHGLRLHDETFSLHGGGIDTVQIDLLVLVPRCIFLIEVKGTGKDVERVQVRRNVSDRGGMGRWSRVHKSGDKEEYSPSPLAQVENQAVNFHQWLAAQKLQLACTSGKRRSFLARMFGGEGTSATIGASAMPIHRVVAVQFHEKAFKNGATIEFVDGYQIPELEDVQRPVVLTINDEDVSPLKEIMTRHEQIGKSGKTSPEGWGRAHVSKEALKGLCDRLCAAHVRRTRAPKLSVNAGNEKYVGENIASVSEKVACDDGVPPVSAKSDGVTVKVAKQNGDTTTEAVYWVCKYCGGDEVFPPKSDVDAKVWCGKCKKNTPAEESKALGEKVRELESEQLRCAKCGERATVYGPIGDVSSYLRCWDRKCSESTPLELVVSDAALREMVVKRAVRREHRKQRRAEEERA